MPVGMEVGLVRGHNVLYGDPVPHRKGHSSPDFSAHFARERSPISTAASLLLTKLQTKLSWLHFTAHGLFSVYLPLPQIFPTMDSLPASGLTPRTSRLDRFFWASPFYVFSFFIILFVWFRAADWAGYSSAFGRMLIWSIISYHIISYHIIS